MSLRQSDLEDDLKEAFATMQNDADFARLVSAAVARYAESGDITTTDAGQVSAGTFSGSGEGKISVDSSVCEGILVSATDSMKSMTSGGDALLAGQLAAGIDAMMAAGTVTTEVIGTATPPPPASPVPVSGTATGTFTGNPALISGVMAVAFPVMLGMVEGGNDFFAVQLATCVTSYLNAGIISTNGTGAVAGSTGSGTGIM